MEEQFSRILKKSNQMELKYIQMHFKSKTKQGQINWYEKSKIYKESKFADCWTDRWHVTWSSYICFYAVVPSSLLSPRSTLSDHVTSGCQAWACAVNLSNLPTRSNKTDFFFSLTRMQGNGCRWRFQSVMPTFVQALDRKTTKTDEWFSFLPHFSSFFTV